MKFFIFFLLIATSNSLRLFCDFGYGNWITLGTVYYCDVTSVDFQGGPQKVIEVIGTHKANESSLNVKMVAFSAFNCPKLNLTNVPQDLLNFFPNNVALSFSSCNVTKLNGDELSAYKNLKFFNLIYSDLEVVPANFFSSTPNMVFVYFGYNKIRLVGKGLLSNLKNLQQANFGKNVCINKWASYKSAIPSLIRVLEQNCTLKCDALADEDFTCRLEADIGNLSIKIDEIHAGFGKTWQQDEFSKTQVAGIKDSHNLLSGEMEALMEKNRGLKTAIELLKSENDELENLIDAQKVDLESLDETITSFAQYALEMLSI